MSGQAGIRGYLLQVAIAVLDAITDGDWIAVTLEPATSQEKADMVWEDKNGTTAVQVKSSQNQLSVPDVTKWAQELESTVKATRYRLVLIGPASQGVIDLKTVGKVEVPTPIPLNITSLIAQTAHKLDLYLERKGISRIPPFARELLVEALIGKLATYSTAGNALCREDLDRLIAQWLLSLYPNAVSKAVAEQVDVLWDTLLFAAPARPHDGSLPLVATITFVNEGVRTCVVEWIALKVTGNGTTKLCTPIALVDLQRFTQGKRQLHADNIMGAFMEFAVAPNAAITLHIGMDQEPNSLRYPRRAWEPGPHTFDLFVKVRNSAAPRHMRSLVMELSHEILQHLSQGSSVSNSERKIDL